MRRPLQLLAALVLIGVTPALARTPQTDWQWYRDVFLGPGRQQLLAFCAVWRDANAQGRSIWEPGLLRSLNEPLRRDGLSDAEIDAMTAGQAVAITRTCTDIR